MKNLLLRKTHSRILTIMLLVFRIILVIGSLVAFALHVSLYPVVAAVFLLSSSVPIIFGKKLPVFWDSIFLIISLFHVGMWIVEAYYNQFYFDEVIHSYSSFFITLAIGYILQKRYRTVYKNQQLLYFITVAAIGVTLGAQWEVYEWAHDFILPHDMHLIESLNDTITDLILDTIGTIVASLLSLSFLHISTQKKYL